MNKINQLYTIVFALFAISIAFTSCKEDDSTTYENIVGQDAFHFQGTDATVTEGSSVNLEIPVIFSKINPVGGNVNITITSADATAGVDYNVVGSSTLTYGEGDYEQMITIEFLDPDLIQTDAKTLTLVLDNASASAGFPGLNGGTSLDSFVVVIEDNDCPFIPTLAGAYTESSTGSTGGGNADVLGHNLTINIAEETTGDPTRYIIDDITMGLYPIDYGASGPNPATFDFDQVTNLIDIDKAASPDIIYPSYMDSFDGSGQVNHNCDGVISTIDLVWTNEYGDNGVTVLTP